MEKRSLYIKVLDAAGNELSFPLGGRPAIVGTFTYSATRMGSAPTLTGTLMYERCLDSDWTYREYVEYNGEKYYVKSIPSSTKSNDDMRYKHEITFVSQRIVLENEYFYDVVTDNTAAQYADRYRSNGVEFSFMGDIAEFAARLNDCLIYVGLYDADTKEGYHVVIDDGIESDTVEVSFDGKYIAEALQEISDSFKLAYYFVGTEIHIGYTQNEIASPLRYGRNKGLLEIQRSNTNNKIVDRITGEGGSTNLEYYYPNDDPEGLADFTTTNFSEEYVGAISLSTIKGYNDSPYNYPYVLCRYASDPTKDLFASATMYVNSVSQGTARTFTGTEYIKVAAESTGLTTASKTKLVYVDFEIRAMAGAQMNVSALLVQGSGTFSNAQNALSMGVGTKKSYGLWTDSVLQDVPTSGNITFGTTGIYRLRLAVTLTFDITGSSTGVAIDGTATYTLTASGAMGYGYGVNEQYFFEYGSNTIGYSLSGIELVDRANLPARVYDYRLVDNTYQRYETSDSSTAPATINIIGRKYIPVCSRLMPSIYRASWGAERYYEARNDTYDLPDESGKYTFRNLYVKGDPHAGRQTDETIYPTIKDMVNASGQLLGVIADIAYDSDDDDSVDEDGNYIHSYFYIKLNKFDGEYGFNLFTHALASDTGKVSMTSGNCAACEFEIGVVWNDANTECYNPVQVDENGNIVAGSYSDKVNENNIIASQQDTETNSVWIALKKDNSTYGVVMPNALNNYKPQVGDTFVLTGIRLPKAYILAAERRLDKVLVEYMKENNEEKFTYSVNFSRIFLARNEDIADKLNENARVTIEYNGELLLLFVTEYTCKADDNILYEVSVTLADDLSSTSTALTQTLAAMQSDIYSAVTKGTVVSGPYIRKDRDDYTQFGLEIGGKLLSDSEARFLSSLIAQDGVRFGREFITGLLGTGAYITGGGHGEMRSLTLWEELTVPRIDFNNVSVFTGINWQTFGGGRIESVEIDRDPDSGEELPSGIITLKLDDGAYGTIDVDDLCQGIFHDYGGTNDDEELDAQNGNFRFKGFNTVYFRIESILDTDTNGRFRYTLRPSGAGDWTQLNHPRAYMDFACYANTDPTKTKRKSCAYSTTQYLVMLTDMDDWEYDSSNITYIRGNLDGFTYAGRTFGDENGVVLGNCYVYGTIQQVTNAPYVLDVAVDPEDYLLEEGDTRDITCTVTKAFDTIDNDHLVWKVTRDTGRPTEDAEWNEEHSDFAGTLRITYDDVLGTDTTITSAVLRFTATILDDNGNTVDEKSKSVTFRAYYVEPEDTSPWYMDIDTRGDSFLAYGETLTATCYVYHGWEQVTDKVEKWTITRDSGDEASDAVWNASDKAKAFAGEIEIGYDDLSLVQLTTYFTATAEGSEIETTSYTVRFG